MTKQGAHPSGMETFRPDPRPAIPTQLQASFRLWLLAVAAGLFETALVVVDATDGEVGSPAQVAVGVAVRLLVFTAAVYLAIQLRLGHNWARVALAVLLGGIGTGSLVIGPVTWLAEGGSPTEALAAADLGSVLFAASRVVHLGAVIAALLLMFHPAANAYLRATTRAPGRRGKRQDRDGGQPADRRGEHPRHQASSPSRPRRLASRVPGGPEVGAGQARRVGGRLRPTAGAMRCRQRSPPSCLASSEPRPPSSDVPWRQLGRRADPHMDRGI
jgi:hypothetical protein